MFTNLIKNIEIYLKLFKDKFLIKHVTQLYYNDLISKIISHNF